MGESYLLVFTHLENGQDDIVFTKTNEGLKLLENSGFIRNMNLPELTGVYELSFDKIGSQLALDFLKDEGNITYYIFSKKGICKAYLYEYDINNSSITEIKQFDLKFDAQELKIQSNKRYILRLINEGTLFGNVDLILTKKLDGEYKICPSIDSSKCISKQSNNLLIKQYQNNTDYQWDIRFNNSAKGYELISKSNQNEFIALNKTNNTIVTINKNKLTSEYEHIWLFEKVGFNDFEIRSRIDKNIKMVLERTLNIEGVSVIPSKIIGNNNNKFILTSISQINLKGGSTK